MRIDVVTPGFPPDPGGVETVAGRLAAELDARGHRLRVFAQRPRGRGRPAGDGGGHGRIAVRRFPDWTGTRRFPVAPGLLGALWRGRADCDVIHAHSFHAAPAMLAAAVPRVPFVFTPHFHGVGHTAAARVLHILYDPAAALLFRRAGAITCVSQAEADLLTSAYPSVAPRVTVIPNGVDVDAIGRAQPFATERPTILVAGRLEAYKRVDTVVRALAAQPRGTARLIVCGDGPHRRGLQTLVGELGLNEEVTFRGIVEDAELRRWQRTALVTLSLSEHEAFGLVPLEAALAGSRVIVSDIPAHRELVARAVPAGRSIVRVDAGVEAAAEALGEALAQRRLAPLLDREFSWSEAADRYEAVLRAA